LQCLLAAFPANNCKVSKINCASARSNRLTLDFLVSLSPQRAAAPSGEKLVKMEENMESARKKHQQEVDKIR